MHSHLASTDWPLWIATPVLQGFILISLFRNRIAPKLLILRFYLVYSILRTAWLMLVACGYPDMTYWNLYWVLQGIGYIFQIGIAINLMATLDVGRSEGRIALGWISVIMVGTAVLHGIGNMNWSTWLNLTRWADCAVWFLLLISVMFVKRWVWPYQHIATGLAVAIGTHFLCAFVQGNSDPSAFLRFCYQLGNLSGLCIWAWTINKTQRLKALMATV